MAGGWLQAARTSTTLLTKTSSRGGVPGEANPLRDDPVDFSWFSWFSCTLVIEAMLMAPISVLHDFVARLGGVRSSSERSPSLAARLGRILHLEGETMNSTVKPSKWPSNIDLPKDQASRSDRDWIRFYERHIRDIETMSWPDRYLLTDTRRALLCLRRSQNARAGKPCPRWAGRLA